MAFTDIDDPTIYFNTKLYTGNGSTNAITGVGFAPDWTLLKDRNDTSGTRAYDTVRGAIKRIRPDLTDAEIDDSDGLTAFGSDGFTLGADGATNANSTLYVSWNWKAGGSASSNSDGDITSSISANTTSGFSIVSYTGSGTIGNTVGHGLGVIPAWVITKNRDAASQWIIWHQGGTSTKNIDLATNNQEYDSSASGWQQGINNVPTSSVLRFTAGSHGNNNVMDSSEKYISYVWTEKQGFSKFGKYQGNGNTDGPFVYTGFRPAWIMVKAIDAEKSWYIWDNKRSTSGLNVVDDQLLADTTDSEFDGSNIDMLSNGFKFRSSGSGEQGNGTNYIYMAFAESPFVNSNGVPTNAR